MIQGRLLAAGFAAFLGVFSGAFLGPGAQAGAPATSPYPKFRPTSFQAASFHAPQPRHSLVPVYYNAGVRPRARPARAHPAAAPGGLKRSLRPRARPRNLRAGRGASVHTVALRRPPAPVRAIGGQGAVCGDRAIRGQRVASLRGALPGCFVARPVRVSSVAGVALSPPAVMDCTTAKSLKKWVQGGAKPAVGRLGRGIGSLRIAASYSCRTRNSQPGAKLSEHGKGKAVDISALTLNNGVVVAVGSGWRDPVKGKILRRLHKAACGPFRTVLGPDADRYHRDHFHFDTARYRAGTYCR